MAYTIRDLLRNVGGSYSANISGKTVNDTKLSTDNTRVSNPRLQADEATAQAYSRNKAKNDAAQWRYYNAVENYFYKKNGYYPINHQDAVNLYNSDLAAYQMDLSRQRTDTLRQGYDKDRLSGQYSFISNALAAMGSPSAMNLTDQQVRANPELAMKLLEFGLNNPSTLALLTAALSLLGLNPATRSALSTAGRTATQVLDAAYRPATTLARNWAPNLVNYGRAIDAGFGAYTAANGVGNIVNGIANRNNSLVAEGGLDVLYGLPLASPVLRGLSLPSLPQKLNLMDNLRNLRGRYGNTVNGTINFMANTGKRVGRVLDNPRTLAVGAGLGFGTLSAAAADKEGNGISLTDIVTNPLAPIAAVAGYQGAKALVNRYNPRMPKKFTIKNEETGEIITKDVPTEEIGEAPTVESLLKEYKPEELEKLKIIVPETGEEISLAGYPFADKKALLELENKIYSKPEGEVVTKATNDLKKGKKRVIRKKNESEEDFNRRKKANDKLNNDYNTREQEVNLFNTEKKDIIQLWKNYNSKDNQTAIKDADNLRKSITTSINNWNTKATKALPYTDQYKSWKSLTDLDALWKESEEYKTWVAASERMEKFKSRLRKFNTPGWKLFGAYELGNLGITFGPRIFGTNNDNTQEPTLVDNTLVNGEDYSTGFDNYIKELPDMKANQDSILDILEREGISEHPDSLLHINGNN